MNRHAHSTRRYKRFSVTQRIEHGILMISFTTLAITGLAQRYVGHWLAEETIRLLGGIERVRQMHHAAALAFAAVSIFHVALAGYRLYVLGAEPKIFPRPDDLTHMIRDIAYNLCLIPEKPPADRYTYREKAEYWAVVWGALLMGATGFMLWNPITTTKYLPGEVIPAAKAAHGLEAVLAVLSILTWHVYHAHIKHFNKSMFTGYLTEEEMLEEHPLELERLKAGLEPRRRSPEEIRRRAAVYVPIATTACLAFILGLYVFLTSEETAITTIPRQVTVTPYAPATPTPTPLPEAEAVERVVLAVDGQPTPVFLLEDSGPGK